MPLPFGYVVSFLPSAPSDTDWDWAIDYLNVLSFSLRAACVQTQLLSAIIYATGYCGYQAKFALGWITGCIRGLALVLGVLLDSDIILVPLASKRHLPSSSRTDAYGYWVMTLGEPEL